MADDDDLKDDPDAKAIQPLHTKRSLIIATSAGAVFGLLLAGAALVFEQYVPRFRPQRPDAGTPSMPTISLEDAGSNDEAPWLRD